MTLSLKMCLYTKSDQKKWQKSFQFFPIENWECVFIFHICHQFPREIDNMVFQYCIMKNIIERKNDTFSCDSHSGRTSNMKIIYKSNRDVHVKKTINSFLKCNLQCLFNYFTPFRTIWWNSSANKLVGRVQMSVVK